MDFNVLSTTQGHLRTVNAHLKTLLIYVNPLSSQSTKPITLQVCTLFISCCCLFFHTVHSFKGHLRVSGCTCGIFIEKYRVIHIYLIDLSIFFSETQHSHRQVQLFSASLCFIPNTRERPNGGHGINKTKQGWERYIYK